MGTQPKYNQRPSRIKQAGRIAATAVFAFAAWVIVVAVLHVYSPTAIACGENSTTVYAHDGHGTQAMAGEAISQMGFAPSDVSNLVTASQQAGQALDQGQPVSVCLEHGNKRVAVINGTQITG